MLAELTDDEILRYNRQIVLQHFDFEKQERLKSSAILIVGLGGLGCAAAQYLAAAGVGKLILLDFDTVTLSNLQRQILHRDSTIGIAKVDSAQQALKKINPYCHVETVNRRLANDELKDLLARVDCVLDCTDNQESRSQLNQQCYVLRKPLVSGAAIRMEGQLAVFTYQNDAPCYQCLSRKINQSELSCVETGIMAPVVGVIGNMQALEAIKIISQYGHPLLGKLLLFDAMVMQFHLIKFTRDPCCEVCGGNITNV